MGATASVLSTIHGLSAEDVARHVCCLGKKFEVYHDTIVDNGVNGHVVEQFLRQTENNGNNRIAHFFESLGITNVIHHQAILDHFRTLDSNHTSAHGGSPLELESPDVLVHPPREILGRMFKLQSIHLDPNDIDYAMSKVIKQIGAPKANVVDKNPQSAPFDCFLSYRVGTDKDVAEKCYLYLKSEGYKPYLDKKCLVNGQDWKEGFLNGLRNSSFFVPLISSPGLAPARDDTKDHSYDNVLIEYQLALHIAEEKAGFVVPVLVGQVEGPALFKFSDFSPSLYSSTVKNEGVSSSSSPSPSSSSSLSTIKIPSGHLKDILCTLVTTDQILVLGSADCTITYWNMQTGEKIDELRKHSGRVHCLCELRDRRIASGSDDTSICIYDRHGGHIEEATALLPTQLHSKSVLCLTLLMDGKLVSGSRDCNIKIWHPASGKFITTLNGHLKSVNALAVMQDNTLLSASGDMTIKLWDVGNGQIGENSLGSCTCIATLSGHKNTIRSLDTLSSGLFISGSDDCTIRVWGKDGNPVKILKGVHTGTVSALVTSEGENSEGSICSVSWDKSLKIFNSENYVVRESFPNLQEDRILSMSILADNRLVTAGADRNIYISACKL